MEFTDISTLTDNTTTTTTATAITTTGSNDTVSRCDVYGTNDNIESNTTDSMIVDKFLVPKTPTYGIMSGDDEEGEVKEIAIERILLNTSDDAGDIDKLLGSKRSKVTGVSGEPVNKLFKPSVPMETVHENILTTAWMYGGFVLVKYDSDDIIIPPRNDGTKGEQSQKSDNIDDRVLGSGVCFTSCRKVYYSNSSLNDDRLSLARFCADERVENAHGIPNFRLKYLHIDNCASDSVIDMGTVNANIPRDWDVSCSVKSTTVKLLDGSTTKILQTRTVPISQAINGILTNSRLPRLPVCNPLELLNLVGNVSHSEKSTPPKFVILFNPEMIWEQIIHNSSPCLHTTGAATAEDYQSEKVSSDSDCGSYGYTLSLRHLNDYFIDSLKENLIGFDILEQDSRYYESVTRFINKSRFPKGYVRDSDVIVGDEENKSFHKDELNQLYMIDPSDYGRLLLVIIRGMYNRNFRLPIRDICPTIAFRIHMGDVSLLSSLENTIQGYTKQYLQNMSINDTHYRSYDHITSKLYELCSAAVNDTYPGDKGIGKLFSSIVNGLLSLDLCKKRCNETNRDRLSESLSTSISVPIQQQHQESLSTDNNDSELIKSRTSINGDDTEILQRVECNDDSSVIKTTLVSIGGVCDTIVPEPPLLSSSSSFVGGEIIRLTNEEITLNELRSNYAKSKGELEEQRIAIQKSTVDITNELKILSDKIADLKSSRELYDNLNKEVDSLALYSKPGSTYVTAYNDFVGSFNDNSVSGLLTANQTSWPDAAMFNIPPGVSFNPTVPHNQEQFQLQLQYNYHLHQQQQQQQILRQSGMGNEFIPPITQEYGNITFTQQIEGTNQQQQTPFPFFISSNKCVCGRIVFLPATAAAANDTPASSTIEKKTPVRRKPRAKKPPKSSTTDGVLGDKEGDVPTEQPDTGVKTKKPRTRKPPQKKSIVKDVTPNTLVTNSINVTGDNNTTSNADVMDTYVKKEDNVNAIVGNIAVKDNTNQCGSDQLNDIRRSVKYVHFYFVIYNL